MNVFDNEEVDVVIPGKRQWFASRGINTYGRETVINFIADDESQANALGHGLGIAYNLHCHQKAEHIGTLGDFNDFSDTTYI